MPKNAVQRLQKLHNELKNVISIYDVANEKSHEALDKKTSKVPSSGHLPEGRRVFQKTDHSGCTPPSRIPFRKSVSFIPRPVGDIHSSHNTKKKCLPPKPDSAPSFSSGLTTIRESDYHFQISPEQKKHSQHQIDNFFSVNVSTKDDYGDESDWSNISSSVMCEIILSPSKTLETANEILKRNNYRNSAGEESSEEDQTTFEIADCHVVEDSSETEGAKSETSEDHVSKNNSSILITQIKKKEDSSKKNSVSNVCVSNENDLAIKSTTSCINVYDSFKKSRPKVHFSKPSTPLKNFQEQQPQVKPLPEIPQVPQGPCNKTKGGEKEQSRCGEKTIGRKVYKKLDVKEKKSINSKISFILDGKDLENIKAKEKLSNKKPSSAHEKSKRKIETFKDRRGKSEEDIPLARKISYRNKIEDGSGEVEVPGNNTVDCNMKYQVATTKEDGENMEKEVKELSRILEKNNEKLEKMKVSKDLALDIAKQLKDKYNEIRNSKNELLKRLKIAEEMDNERLSDEVKDEKNSKIKLQQKMEEIKQDSNTLILEQNIKNKEILKENARLKSKLKELETLYEQEKRQVNNSSQKERMLESKYDLNLQDKVSEENIQRLIKEKSELVFKTETLRRLLRERELQVKSLEAITSEYEEELRQNQQLLQQKTERLEDTNKELESIRQNSKDLEEQVKMLRISIESFDQIHQNLIKQAMAYENEVKTHREHIKKLEEENHKLKKEYENAKDSLLIKNKIIDDQQQSLKQQKDKSEEIKALVKKNQSLERIINIEREEKIELQDAVERLKWRKEELKKN